MHPATKPALAALLVLASSSAVHAQSPAHPVPADAALRVDSVFARWDSVTTPGCAVGVAVDGLTVLSRAYGMADLEHGIPNTPGTIFEGGSLSKQVTGATVVRLALDGRLSLDDDIRTHVPEVPDYGRTITLRHLLNHTSGLRDWGNVAGISGWGREERSHTHDDALAIIARQTALNYVPGHRYSYTNTGYTLLAIAAERVAGTSLRALSDSLLFAPLGMDDTQWRDDYRRIVPGRSTAYERTADGWEINRPIEHVYGNGGLLTTVGDLLTWNQAMADRRFGADFHRLMHEVGVLNDGSPIVYASGLRLQDFHGVPSVTHTGSTAGYRAFLGRYPDQGVSVAMLCNASNAPTGGNGGAVARIYLGDAATDPVAPAAAAVDPTVLAGYARVYREPVTGRPLEVTWEDGVLLAGRDTLVPLSATEWAEGPGEDRWVVVRGDGGRPTLRHDSWATIDERFEPVEAWTPDGRWMDDAQGAWWSDDAGTRLETRVEDGELVLFRPPAWTRAMEPLYDGAFRAGGWIVRFPDGPDGDELSISLGRVYDMRFRRVRE